MGALDKIQLNARAVSIPTFINPENNASKLLGQYQDSIMKEEALAAEQANREKEYLLRKANADRTYDLGLQKQQFLEGAEGRELERQAQQAQAQAEANALLSGKKEGTVTNSIKKTESTFTPQVQADINTQYENLLKSGNADAALKFKEQYGYDVDEPIMKQMPGYVPGVSQVGGLIGEAAYQTDKGLNTLRNYLGYDQEKDVANDPIKYAGVDRTGQPTYKDYRIMEEARKEAKTKQDSYNNSLEALNKQAILSSVGTKDKIEKETKKILRDRTDDEKLALLAEAASNIDTSTKEGKNKAIPFQKTYDTILSNKEAKDIYKTKQILKNDTEEKRFQRDIDLALIKERINSGKKGKPSVKEISAAKGIVEYSKGFFNDDDSQEVLAAKALLDSQGISY